MADDFQRITTCREQFGLNLNDLRGMDNRYQVRKVKPSKNDYMKLATMLKFPRNVPSI